MADLYDVLGVSSDASPEEIKAVYRQLARTFHPDVNAYEEAIVHFRRITEAFVVLSDPEKRKSYDRQRRRRKRHRELADGAETYLWPARRRDRSGRHPRRLGDGAATDALS